MPAVSERQKHTAQMALAYKHGKPIKTFPGAARAAIKSMAEMSDSQLRDFMKLKKKKTLMPGH